MQQTNKLFMIPCHNVHHKDVDLLLDVVQLLLLLASKKQIPIWLNSKVLYCFINFIMEFVDFIKLPEIAT